MRIGVPAIAEVRIARDKVDGLLQALNGRDPKPSADAPTARALSVRLQAAKGGFWIEPGDARDAVDRERARPRRGRLHHLALDRGAPIVAAAAG